MINDGEITGEFDFIGVYIPFLWGDFLYFTSGLSGHNLRDEELGGDLCFMVSNDPMLIYSVETPYLSATVILVGMLDGILIRIMMVFDNVGLYISAN